VDPLSPSDIFRVPRHTDGGVWKHAGANLRPFRDKYRFAVIVIDADFDPHPGPAVLLSDISTDMMTEGWERERFAVIVIQPELEAWLWAPNLNVARAFGHEDFGALRRQLEQEQLWDSGDPKPKNLKHATARAAKLGKKQTGGPIFMSVFGAISMRACQSCVEPGFVALRAALQNWFPAPSPGSPPP
jgi:hypothetical protein